MILKPMYEITIYHNEDGEIETFDAPAKSKFDALHIGWQRVKWWAMLEPHCSFLVGVCLSSAIIGLRPMRPKWRKMP